MLGAVAAVGFWSVSTFASARASRHLGGISANLIRLVLAFPLVGLVALAMGLSPVSVLDGPAMSWLVLSGIFGVCACDILTLMAYARLGPRIPTLLVDCGSVPIAVLIGWLWLEEVPSAMQLWCMALTISGLVVVLRPRADDRSDAWGIANACAAGVFFALASVCVRMSLLHPTDAMPVHWLEAAVIRLGSGLLATAAVFVVIGSIARTWRDGPAQWHAALPWLALNALLGPGLGLTCFQWALVSTQASVVHAIIAFVPLVVLMTEWLMRRDRPDALGVYGSIASVLGVVLLLCTGPSTR